MTHDPLAEWEQLQTQLTATRRQWLQAVDPQEREELYARLLALQAMNGLMEEKLRTQPAEPRQSWWPMALLGAMILLPLLVLGVLVAKYWVNEWALQRLFAQTPPLAQWLVAAEQRLPLNELGVELRVEMVWIGRLEVAQLTFISSTGATETHTVLGGEVLALPPPRTDYLVHVQQIDYEEKTVKIVLFQDKSVGLTISRHASAISSEKRRWSTLTSNSV
ncbi:hypothetical protein [Thioflexithrix psekupsensis]|uniref:hypothetical protein n=1 Tax=Thioflexithrix psekupsensis TaxID=1570016 RepID=UPI00111F83BE|nr:hypothetical protein [Thioflexithrix psekupsensis]